MQFGLTNILITRRNGVDIAHDTRDPEYNVGSELNVTNHGYLLHYPTQVLDILVDLNVPMVS